MTYSMAETVIRLMISKATSMQKEALTMAAHLLLLAAEDEDEAGEDEVRGHDED